MSQNTEKTIVVDQPKRLSESKLWQFQQDYFDFQGIEAWAGAVPFYVTSNHSITQSYAETAFAFMQDWLQQHPQQQDEIFYLVELGTGSGQFSYYTLHYLTECLQRCPVKKRPKFCYVMTDFTENNLKFWKQHPGLKPFVEKGILDFAQFNMEKDSQIELVVQNKTIKKGNIKNPMIVFANYIFDTVSNDAFRVQAGSIEELQVRLKTSSDNIKEDGSIRNLDNIECDFSTKEINANSYYADKRLNDILKYYQNHVDNSHMLIPIAGIKTIDRLIDMSNNQLMLISSDKAYTELSDMDYRNTPHIAFHGSFSLMVNYDAIVRFFNLSGGECVIPTPRQGLKTVLCIKGAEITKMPRLQRAIAHHIENFTPSDYFTLYRYFMDTKENLDIDQMLSVLAFTNWDPYVFNKLINRIMSILKDANETAKARLLAELPKLDKHFYLLPNCSNTYFNIAICYYILGDHKQALSYYDRAELSHGTSSNLHYNQALCYHELNKKLSSLEYFKKSLALDPGNESIQEWINRLS